MSAVLSPSERLVLSREGLRAALKASSAAPGEGTTARRNDKSIPDWLDSVKSIPGASVLIDAGMDWWSKHPFRTACLVAAEAAKAVVQPIVQRNPVGMILVAALLGAVIVRTRPWRWLLTPALFAGLLPQLLSKAVAQMPTRSWMAVLTSLIQAQQRPGKPDTP